LTTRSELHELVDSLAEKDFTKVSSYLKQCLTPELLPDVQTLRARVRETMWKLRELPVPSGQLMRVTGSAKATGIAPPNTQYTSEIGWIDDAFVRVSLLRVYGQEVENTESVRLVTEDQRIVYSIHLTGPDGREIEQAAEFRFTSNNV